MTDRISKEQRSRNMSAVHSRGNLSTELALVKIFRKEKITGWTRNKKIVGIHPDFVFLKRRAAVFVHGCFWHGCRWHGEIPASNIKFWHKKIDSNINRDLVVKIKLRKAGWKVLYLWEHEFKGDSGVILAKIKKVVI